MTGNASGAGAPTGFVGSPAGFAALPPERARRHLVDRQAAFAAALETGDLDAPVPACPGWSLRRLAWHLGTVHRWAVGAVEQGRPLALDEVGPDDAAELAGWYRAAAADLVARLEATPADAPCWTFGPTPRTARFWSRRQAHETAMHALDAAQALSGAGPVPTIAADLALDGIDEVVTVFLPRQVRRQRIEPLGRSLAVLPDEGGGVRWVLAGDGSTPSDDLPAAEATLRGPADLLLRVLWKRLPLDARGVGVEGDHGAAAAVLTARITP
ncbi:MAG: maleylpyruvate isomerase family mycothiol-dependent enzyme [Kineosporiaceae bacterium]